ncbi:MAG: ComEC family competence protein [Candidatus Omnitrophica bacterium]|nr:ComEC family competence protein [Candidatus Omnitrophota bacterium]
MTRPLVVLTIAFCSGIIFSRLCQVPFWAIFLPNAFILALILISRKTMRALLIILAFGLGAIFRVNAYNLAESHVLRSKLKSHLVVKGIVEDIPQIRGNRTIFPLKVEAIEAGNTARRSCGTLRIFLNGRPDFSYGDELILKGRLEKAAVMRVRSLSDVTRVSRNKGFFLKRVALWARRESGIRMQRYTSSLTSAVLSAMVLGEKRNIPWFVNNLMVRTGTVHILVVSGFNVGIVSFTVLLILKLLRVRRDTRFIITISCLIFYCLLTGASTPVVRATIMAVFFLSGYLIRREPDIYNSLSMAALFILVFNPGQLFDIGFQLSFVSVLAIVCLYPALSKLIAKYFFKKGWVKFLIDSLLISLSAWLGTCAFIAYYFRIFSPVTVLANLFVVPLATLITLCGFSLVLISLICPALGFAFGSSAEALVFILLRINASLADLPGACLKF